MPFSDLLQKHDRIINNKISGQIPRRNTCSKNGHEIYAVNEYHRSINLCKTSKRRKRELFEVKIKILQLVNKKCHNFYENDQWRSMTRESVSNKKSDLEKMSLIWTYAMNLHVTTKGVQIFMTSKEVINFQYL